MTARLAALALLAVAAAPAPRAGPPLICFPLDIGDAVSLPIKKDGGAAPTSRGITELVADALTLLRRSDDATFHVETIRRFVVAAMERNQESRSGIDALRARLVDELLFVASAPQPDARRAALSWLDLGVVLAAGSQAGLCGAGESRRFLESAARRTPDDPSLTFCVALAEFWPSGDERGWIDHFQRLAAGPVPDAVRRNAVATLGVFLGAKDWERLVAEVRKRSGRV